MWFRSLNFFERPVIKTACATQQTGKERGCTSGLHRGAGVVNKEMSSCKSEELELDERDLFGAEEENDGNEETVETSDSSDEEAVDVEPEPEVEGSAFSRGQGIVPKMKTLA